MKQSTLGSAPPSRSIQELPSSLQYIAKKLEKTPDMHPQQMAQLLQKAQIQVEDLLPWADWDHPVEDSYGRKMVYKGANFEIMVMSWMPGDFSAIHDHGYTQWGAVQIFGPAEHACFTQQYDRLRTNDRWKVQTGEIVPVYHDLIHQMGNPTDEPFLSIHVYGELEPIDNVTGDARIFDAETGTILRVDGGVFFQLPETILKRREAGPQADFPTRLRHLIELVRRLQRMETAAPGKWKHRIEKVIRELFAPGQRQALKQYLAEIIDANGHFTDSKAWSVLIQELKAAAQLQQELAMESIAEDKFHRYAQLYDAVIGQPCLEDFMAGYLRHFTQRLNPSAAKEEWLSIGCGTGLTEDYLIKKLDVDHRRMTGIDISEGMIREASQRIHAFQADLLSWDTEGRQWDIAYTGLNVFHYLPHQALENAIRKTAALVKPGGYFIGDFITPDHIRWYPNAIFSKDEQVISLRTPRFVEDEDYLFNESEILNIDFTGDFMRVNYAGRHKRFLPPMLRVREYFEQYFKGTVILLDAHNLEVLPRSADTCKSTRYVVVAKR